MSYLALARKYRPQTFEEIVGQGHVTRTLQNAITKGQIHHAFLFTGTRGVGKTTAARILAKALNCASGPGPVPVPCNACTPCREITGGTSVDVLEIDGASNRGIDDVRELRESVRYLPSAARYRVIIIDEVHMLTREAFNALLKTLEEPPAHVKFVFATTDPHRLPGTILSRVQRYDFREISARAIHQYLADLTAKEGLPFSDDNLTLIVRKARGSMRDALSLLDQAISFGGETAAPAELADLLGITDWRHLFALSQAILARDAEGCLDRFEQVFHYAYDVRQFYLDLLEHFRNLVVVRAVKDPSALVDATREELEELVRLASAHAPEHLQMLFRMLVAAEDEILRSTGPKLVLEMTLLSMATAGPVASIDELLGRLADLSAGGGVPSVPGAAPSGPLFSRGAESPPTPWRAAPEPAPAAPAPPREPREILRALVAKRSVSLAAMLEESFVAGVAVEGKRVRVQSKSRFCYGRIAQGEGFATLRDAVSEWLGPDAEVEVLPPAEEGGGSVRATATPDATAALKQEAAVRRQALQSDVVQDILELFDGRIVDIRIEGK